jgi:hypothetical protein
MIVTEESCQPATDVPDAEALIKEARQRQRRRWVSVVVAAVVVALAGGIAIHMASPASKPPAQTTTGTRPSGADTTAYPTCDASQLALVQHIYQVAMDGAFVIYSVTNRGVTPCSLQGAPRYAALSAGGKAVETVVEGFPRAVGKRVNLPPGGTGSFAVWWDTPKNSVPSSELRSENATTSWTFRGQRVGIAQDRQTLMVGPSAVGLTVSAIEARVMSHPPWLPEPSAQSKTLGTTYVFGP